MKTLIAYATKSGASRECAKLLADKLADCFLVDLSKQVPDIASYDTVILGSGVRMGNIYKPMRGFIEKNRDALLAKKIAIYLCNSYPNTFQKAIEKNIPKELTDRCLCIESLGGIPPFTSSKNRDWILLEHVDRLVQIIISEESKTGL